MRDELPMKTILVVEDDADTRNIWSTILQHHGYTVFDAADGTQGILMAREQNPDLIVMNLSMPRLDGISTTVLLRNDPKTANIPIIACTGFVRDDGEDHAEEAGCNAYIEKPCEPSRLVAEIERFLGPAAVIAGA